MPPSAFLVNPTICTKTLSTPTKTIATKASKNSDICAAKVQVKEEEQTSKITHNNNCSSAQNYNYTAFGDNERHQEQNLHNMVLQSYENYATYHLPTHSHHHLHHHNHQQQRNNQFQTQNYDQHLDSIPPQQQQFQPSSVYQPQQQPNQSQHVQLQQHRLSSGSSASSSSTASSIVGSSTAASLGIGYFNELSNFVSTDFSATQQHAASNLHYTDNDANFFSQGKNQELYVK